jgi:hypothetical protein
MRRAVVGRLCCLLLVYAGWAGALPEVVRLGNPARPCHTLLAGALFDNGAKSEQRAFVRSIEMVNDDRTIMTRSRLTEVIATYPRDDSFKASRRLCDLIQPGLAAIFGPTAPISSNHVQSVADTLHLPFMETRWDYGFQRAEYSINLHPHPSQLGAALADFVRKVGWKSLVLLYEKEEGLVTLQELIKLPKTFGEMGVSRSGRAPNIVMTQFTDSSLQVTLRQLPPDTTDYRPLLKEVKKSEETRIVLDCDFDKIELILEQAAEIELLTDYHNYLVTSLDLDKVNLEPYSHTVRPCVRSSLFLVCRM